MPKKRSEKIQTDPNHAGNIFIFFLQRIRLLLEDGALEEEKPKVHPVFLLGPYDCFSGGGNFKAESSDEPYSFEMMIFIKNSKYT